jgi:hypothetical protein
MSARTTASLFGLALALTVTAAPLKQEDIIDASREVVSELQECSVYFVLSPTCFAEQSPAMARDYRAAADRIGVLALKVGRSVGLSTEAFLARHSLLSEEMMDAIQKSCVNIAVLQRRYAKFCLRLSQDTDSRLKEWIACKQAQQSPCPGGPL